MADSCRFSQSHGIMGLTVDGDWNAGFSSDSFSMGKYNHATILILGDASITGAAVITVMAGATDAAETAAVTFAYRYAGGDIGSASSDVYGAAATSASLTTTVASMDSRVTVLEFDAADLNVSGVQYEFVTVVVSAAGTAGTASIIAILSEPRFAEAIMDTAQ